MQGLEIAGLFLLFYVIYKCVNPPPSTADNNAEYDKIVTGTRLQQLVHKYRTEGVDRITAMSIKKELSRRGCVDYPGFGGDLADPEVMARLHLLLEQKKYVPRNNGESDITSRFTKNPNPLFLEYSNDDSKDGHDRKAFSEVNSWRGINYNGVKWQPRFVPVQSNAPNS